MRYPEFDIPLSKKSRRAFRDRYNAICEEYVVDGPLRTGDVGHHCAIWTQWLEARALYVAALDATLQVPFHVRSTRRQAVSIERLLEKNSELLTADRLKRLVWALHWGTTQGTTDMVVRTNGRSDRELKPRP